MDHEGREAIQGPRSTRGGSAQEGQARHGGAQNPHLDLEGQDGSQANPDQYRDGGSNILTRYDPIRWRYDGRLQSKGKRAIRFRRYVRYDPIRHHRKALISWVLLIIRNSIRLDTDAYKERRFRLFLGRIVSFSSLGGAIRYDQGEISIYSTSIAPSFRGRCCPPSRRINSRHPSRCAPSDAPTGS